jgi:hypothetical protein
MSARTNGFHLWNIRGPGLDVLFVGSPREMVEELARLDRMRGGPHAARQVRA